MALTGAGGTTSVLPMDTAFIAALIIIGAFILVVAIGYLIDRLDNL